MSAPHELALRILNDRAAVRDRVAQARAAMATNDATKLAEVLVELCDRLNVQLVVRRAALDASATESRRDAEQQRGEGTQGIERSASHRGGDE